MFTLKKVLLANAASCIIFGLIFLAFPTAIAVFLGGEMPLPSFILQILGGVLVINGAHLVWTSFIEEPNKFLILYFSFGDFLWMIGTKVLIAMGVGITTGAGIITAILIAIIVTIFGVLQIIKRREMCNL